MEFLGIISTHLLAITAELGYLGIIVLMAIESSFIPFPSEIVIPPAAFLASQGQMNIVLVVISGVIGSIIGALVNYFIALTLGRAIIYRLVNMKWAKYLLLNKKQLQKAENYFIKYGNSTTFICRLVPAIRQLISLPAGFSRMNIWAFLLYTFLGSTTWVIILALLGYYFGAAQETLKYYYHEISMAGVFLGFVFVVYVGYMTFYKKDKAAVKDDAGE